MDDRVHKIVFVLTDAVWMLETAEKWHLSNLNHTSKNFCPMMVLTIGHKKIAPGGPHV